MRIKFLPLAILPLSMLACDADTPDEAPAEFVGAENEVRLMTLNPGHFHAGLVQKYEYQQVDPVVHVYAPDGRELESHLALIEQFNTREDEEPTNWDLEVYRGDDYLDRMLEERPGNVMVVAGDNAQKIEYVSRAVENGIHVLADKPMVINPDGFEQLTETLESADARGLLVNDIMTERHEITSILQRELSRMPELFGEMVPGTPDEPGIVKESVHYFAKTVAGAPLIRPVWFFDVNQQGEAIVDVSTHLVDLILWQSFPGESIDYRNPDEGVDVLSARVWDTSFTPSQFERVTQVSEYPDYLMPYVEGDSVLNVAANGEFVFRARDVYGRVAVLWGYENPDGGDTHFSVMRGTQANLYIRQDEEQDYVATLYVEPAGEVEDDEFGRRLDEALERLGDRYPGLTAEPSELGWEVSIPDEFREGHEDHFTRVTENYLQYLIDGQLPDWERRNLETKYYITTRAYELSR